MASDVGETAGRGGPVHVLPLLVIGLIASALGIAFGVVIDWFPVQASSQAKPIDDLWDVLIWVSVPIFVLVATVVLYSAYKWRMRPWEEGLDGPPIHGSTRLEVIWTAIPAVILVVLVGYAYIVLTDIEEAKANQMNVRVVGEQFAWTYYYGTPGNAKQEIKSTQLYLPVGQQVQFKVQSKDVIHDFWIPAFRMKIDAVPGEETRFLVDTTRTGRYPVVCAELCGLGHAVMRSTANVLERGEFDRWLAEQAQEAREAQ